MKRAIQGICFVVLLVTLVVILKSAFPKNAGALNLFLPLFFLDALLWLDTKKRIGNIHALWRGILTTAYWIPLALIFAGTITGFFIPFSSWPVFFKTYLISFSLIAYLTKIFPIIAIALNGFLKGTIILFRLWLRPTIHPIPSLRGLVIAGWLLGGLLFTTMMAGMVFWEHDFTVKKVKITLPELPPGLIGFRIVHLSDLHLGSWNNATSLETFVRTVNTLHPDVVFFTGDICNYSTTEVWPFQPVLSQIKARYGVFSVLGNHDYGDYMTWPSPDAKSKNMQELMRFYEEMGWVLLRNDHALIGVRGDSLAVIGVENWGANKRFQRLANLPHALTGTEHVPVKLLLSHDPSYWDSIVSQYYPGIDVTFSGHTHGGQVGIEWNGLKWSPAQYIMPHWAGLYTRKHETGQQQYLYVNQGAGTIGYAGRVGILPEITLIELN